MISNKQKISALFGLLIGIQPKMRLYLGSYIFFASFVVLLGALEATENLGNHFFFSSYFSLIFFGALKLCLFLSQFILIPQLITKNGSNNECQ